MRAFVLATMVILTFGTTIFLLNRSQQPISVESPPEYPVAFDAKVAKEKAKIVEEVRGPELPTLDLANVSQEEVNEKIAEIDNRIALEKYVEKANSGALSPEQLLEFRRLLHNRNQYFAKKFDLDEI